MVSANSSNNPANSKVREDWVGRVTTLVQDVENWAGELGWSTRRIDKQLDDSQIGSHTVPALLVQEGPVRVFVEPIARSAPGAEGVVDLYLMPAYDDIASLYFVDGQWQVHYMFPESPTVATIRDAESKPLTKETLQQVLDAMSANAG
ncbi:MAG: hypothetical protein L0211_02195 [Planctomycetaceae bacterium]|nr:hypothetical protein [Planctomycetaceae bacterium]